MGNTPRSLWVKSFAAIAAGGLVLTACGGSSNDATSSSSAVGGGGAASSSAGSSGSGSSSESSSAGGGGGETTGVVTGFGSEPQNPLIPTNTQETGGGDIVDLIFAGLIHYDAEGKPVNEIADSIDTSDGQNYDIKIKSGYKFTNGEDVTAQSFVDAWNFGALSTNAQLNTSWFTSIKGYDDVSYCEKDKGPADADGKPTCLPAPKAQSMSGLVVKSPTEFTVELASAQSDFPLQLGYAAWYPMAKAALADIKTAGETPISDGPYKVAKWDHGQQIQLVPNPDYNGPRKAHNGGVTLTFYPSADAAYADLLSDNLDVTNVIPASSLASFQSDLGDRAVNQASAIFQAFTVPNRLPHFGGDEGKLRRQAISYAINRPEITQVIFNDTRIPATDFLAKTIPGWSDSLQGSDVLKFNDAKAKELWAQADAIAPWGDSTFELAYNQNGGHKEWVEAVTNGLNNVLPAIHAAPKEYAVFGEFRSAITDRSIQTPFRAGWQFDYPGPYNLLSSLFLTSSGNGNGANDGDYSNPDFDKLVGEGITATSVDAGIQKFQQAEEILFKDLPEIPLWYSNATGGFSTKVTNAKFDWHGVPIYWAIEKAS